MSLFKILFNSSIRLYSSPYRCLIGLNTLLKSVKLVGKTPNRVSIIAGYEKRF